MVTLSSSGAENVRLLKLQHMKLYTGNERCIHEQETKTQTTTNKYKCKFERVSNAIMIKRLLFGSQLSSVCSQGIRATAFPGNKEMFIGLQ